MNELPGLKPQASVGQWGCSQLVTGIEITYPGVHRLICDASHPGATLLPPTERGTERHFEQKVK